MASSLYFSFANQYSVGEGFPFPIVLVPRYKLCLCHTPIKPDLLGFPGIGVFVCGLRDHVITRFASNVNHELVEYADARFLYDPYKGQSQASYLFTCGNIDISWRSTKQTLVVTLSNHDEILAIHEANRECVWLRSMTQHIRGTYGLSS